MNFRERFAHKSVFPVVHIRDYETTIKNLIKITESGADGVFLIDHGHNRPDNLVSLIKRLKHEGWHHRLWLGANFLNLSNRAAIQQAAQLKLGGLWADNAGRYDEVDDWNAELGMEHDLVSSDLLYFGGIAFKYQRQPDDIKHALEGAKGYLDVVTTSGSGTGSAASLEKLQEMRKILGNHPLATASGVTPENAKAQFAFVDAVLVATGIAPGDGTGDNFFEIDRRKLEKVVDVARSIQPPN